MAFMWELQSQGGLDVIKLTFATILILILWQGMKGINLVLSWILNAYLLHTYRIYHVEDSSGRLPTAPYQWPNGQGSFEKYVNGKENSGKWQREYGDIYRVWSGTTGEIVLTKPEHIRAVFKDSGTHFKAIDNNSGHVFNRLLGACLGFLSGAEWQRVRSVFDAPFSHAAVEGYDDLVIEETEKYFQRLMCTRPGTDSSMIIDPVADFKMLPFGIMARIVYGELPESLISKLHALVPLRERLFGQAIKGGIIRFKCAAWLPFAPGIRTVYRELADFERRWEAFNNAAYQFAVAASEKKQQPPIVSMYRNLAEGNLTKAQLLQTADEILFANLDVTLGAISWAIVYQAADQSIQQRLLEETFQQGTHASDATATATNVTKSDPGSGCRYVSASYLHSQTTFLQACILEAARLKPSIPFTTPQAAPTERVLDGYRVPAGTNFVVDTHALNTRNDFWGQGVAEYRPDRFLEARLRGGDLRYQYWRFGFGPRQCMGKYLGDLIGRAILIELVASFRLSLPEENRETWARDVYTWVTQPVVKVICDPRAQ